MEGGGSSNRSSRLRFMEVLRCEVLVLSDFVAENVGKAVVPARSDSRSNYRGQKLTISDFAIAQNVPKSCLHRWTT